MTGIVLNIQRFRLDDGPGIRTTVNLKGCALRCQWCNQPEARRRQEELSFNVQACLDCGECFDRCAHGGHQRKRGAHTLNRDVCCVCGDCAEACAGGALEKIGHQMSASQVMAVVARDLFFTQDGGGLTIAGGEPLMQVDYVEELLKLAKAMGVHSCLATNGFGDYKRLERLLPLVDLFLYNLRAVDNEQHIGFTGVPNRSILSNLHRLLEQSAKVRLRLPLVVGINDSAQHLQAIGELVAQLPRLEGVEAVPCQARPSRITGSALGHVALLKQSAPSLPDASRLQLWSQALKAACGQGAPLLCGVANALQGND